MIQTYQVWGRGGSLVDWTLTRAVQSTWDPKYVVVLTQRCEA